MISDNLGNTRVRFADFNGDKKINIHDEGVGQEKELLGSFHYYPFGLKMEGIFHDQEATECRYQYNGIEFISHANLGINLATWRTNDSAIGRWWQVDPKAEMLYGFSPYCSMNNNPVLFNDPNGDIVIAPLILWGIGAAIRSTLSGINSEKSGGSFLGGFVHGFINAGASAGFSAGVGMSFGHGVGSLTNELGRAVTHALGGGILAFGQGGNVLSGFVSSGLSSGISSIHSLGDLGGIIEGTIVGGIGDELSGGNFLDGAITGLSVTALNHFAFNVIVDIKTRHIYKKIYQGGDPNCLLACGAMIAGMSLKDFKNQYLAYGGKYDATGSDFYDFNAFMISKGFSSVPVNDLSGVGFTMQENGHVVGIHPDGSSAHAVLLIRFRQWSDSSVRINFIDPFYGVKGAWNFKSVVDWAFLGFK